MKEPGIATAAGLIITLLLLPAVVPPEAAAVPHATWAKTYGFGFLGYAFASSIQQTSDGGFIIAGTTGPEAADLDAWVLKLGAKGSIVWQNTYGGTRDDRVASIQQTSDGGFIAAGFTNSFGAGGYDAWVFRLDAVGDVVWQKTYGGALSDSISSIEQTSDGGFIVAGDTEYAAAWVLRLDASGDVAWQKRYGGTRDDVLSIRQTSDGGFIAAGRTYSFGAGDLDAWVLRLDAFGGVVWLNAYGGTGPDKVTSVEQTSDGGFIAAGSTMSFRGLPTSWAAWVFRLDAVGDVVWQNTYVTGAEDYPSSIHQTSDGGFIVAGSTRISSWPDAWVFRLDAMGSVVWQRAYGGALSDSISSIEQTSDGGFIAAGSTNSFGDASGRLSNVWVMKLNSNGIIRCGLIKESSVTVTNVAIPGTTTTATPVDSSANVTVSSATVTATSATTQVLCPHGFKK